MAQLITKAMTRPSPLRTATLTYPGKLPNLLVYLGQHPLPSYGHGVGKLEEAIILSDRC